MNKFFATIFLIFSVFFVLPISIEAKTASIKPEVKKIKILIVPGHDDEVWGAQYGNFKEADMNLRVALELQKNLKKDKRFEVFITRSNGDYNKTFSDYLSKKDEINLFKETLKKQTAIKVEEGDFVKKEGVPHVAVNQDTSIKLYGINKWANENDIDAVIHIHFNDYPRKNKWTIGKYKGFVVYVPEIQLLNAKESIRLGEKIFSELKKKYSLSTFPEEKGGLVLDQKLIALGANGSLDQETKSVLVEYGYIYEKKFRNTKTRRQAYVDMATLTASGIKSYFFTK
ncbi:MAG: N-acetylmuramoyl-L-alanine amidase [Patescibacteria group bacterium]